MENKDVTGVVPDQYTGKEIIAEASRETGSVEEAKALYAEARSRLLDVNQWDQTGSIPGSKFELLDSDGDEADREVQEFDYFRISIPGPGTKEGDGYDWVYVEELKEVNEEDVESIAFRVRPTSNPDSPSSETAHFYSSESTSTFMVTREQNRVRVTILDKNIMANDEASSFADKVRDKLVALGGINGLSKLQWETLAKGVLGTDN
jgi:hypothetical protein